MPDSLNIATSGLLALQRAVSTTSNNIVNVNTEGYSRQVVKFVPNPSQQFGNGFIGSGVNTSGIERIYNRYLVDQVHDFTASSSNVQTFADMAARLDNVLADPSSGLNQNVQKFFSSLHDLANNPASIPERRVVLSEAEALTTQVGFLNNSLDQLGDEVNSRLESLTVEINELASNLAHINERIAALSDPSANVVPNDLLDQRDVLLTRLSDKVGIRVVEQNSGGSNVFIGTGQPLVVGSQYSELGTTSSVYDNARLEIVYQDQANTVSNITGSITGGQMQGLLDFRDKVLDDARNRLGLLTTGISEGVNAQHRAGLDLSGNFGGDVFSASAVTINSHPSNTGAATVTATIEDASQMKASDYLLRYDGAQWMALRQSDDVVTTSAGSLTLDGIDITIGGAPAAGDSFLLRGVHLAASDFKVALREPGGLAAAAPIRLEVAGSNVGDAQLNDLTALNTSALASDITMTFDEDALGPGLPGYVLTGGAVGTIAYDPATDSAGLAANIAGVANFQLGGVPETGDILTLQHNASAGGDNRNAVSLAGLQNVRMLENGEATYQSYYGNLVADVGVKTRQASVNAETESSLLGQAQSARDGVSGVNLEEEAANLLRFQQAYQAAAQIIGISDSLFQTLLSVTGR